MATGELTEKMVSETSKIKEIINAYGLTALQGKENELQRMVLLAQGMSELQKAITPEMMGKIMALQSTKLGFRTDKDAGNGYPEAIVKDVAIEAMLRGANMTGNEVNIIAGNCYLTKEFYQRAVKQLPGVTDVVVEMSVPTMAGEKGALVSGWVKYKLNGEEKVYARTKESESRDMRIAVRVNSGMGTDAIFGKAERKLLAGVYSLITGLTIVDGEVDDNPHTVTGTFEKPTSKTPADVTASLKGNGKRPMTDAERFELESAGDAKE